MRNLCHHEYSATAKTLNPSPMQSVWQLLRNHEINSCEQALAQLVQSDGTLRLELLDEELNRRFFAKFGDWQSAPPVIPLLLWRNCFYVGCPRQLSAPPPPKFCASCPAVPSSAPIPQLTLY
jgi:hypothetical protein